MNFYFVFVFILFYKTKFRFLGARALWKGFYYFFVQFVFTFWVNNLWRWIEIKDVENNGGFWIHLNRGLEKWKVPNDAWRSWHFASQWLGVRQRVQWKWDWGEEDEKKKARGWISLFKIWRVSRLTLYSNATRDFERFFEPEVGQTQREFRPHTPPSNFWGEVTSVSTANLRPLIPRSFINSPFPFTFTFGAFQSWLGFFECKKKYRQNVHFFSDL